MKKQQKTLSQFESEAKKIVDKYADYKKLKRRFSQRNFGYIWNFYSGTLKGAIKPTFRLWKKQPKQKFKRYRRASVFTFCIRNVIWKYC